MNQARTLVFSYGDFVATTVDTLIAAGAEVVGVVAPSNRKGPNVEAVKSFAQTRGLPLFVQHPRKRIAPFMEKIHALDLDVIFIWSYTMLLPPAVIEVPRLGAVNMHGGLLPEYRGGHVLQWAIINGETETGVTLHYIDSGIDTGPLIVRASFPVEWEDDAASVQQKLKSAGVQLITEWWSKIATGAVPHQPQDENQGQYYPMRTAEDGQVDWSTSNTKVYNLVRALVRPWPGAFTFWHGRTVIVWKVRPVDSAPGDTVTHVPGTIIGIESTGIQVVTGAGDVVLREIEIDGTVIGPEGFDRVGFRVGDHFAIPDVAEHG